MSNVHEDPWYSKMAYWQGFLGQLLLSQTDLIYIGLIYKGYSLIFLRLYFTTLQALFSKGSHLKIAYLGEKLTM